MAKENSGDPRPTRTPEPDANVSETGVLIMRRSIQELAARHSISEADLVASLAKQEIQLITTALEKIPPATADAIRLTEDRVKLIKNADYISNRRQGELERSYKRWVSYLKGWLPESKTALAMLDVPRIESLESDFKLASHGSLADRVTRIANAVQIFSPLVGGFRAKASPLDHFIQLHHGIHDCMHLASVVICRAAIDDDGNGNMLIHDMRKNPKQCDQAIASIRQIIELAAGKRLAASVPEKITAAQGVVASRLTEGALMYVAFHELAHILLGPRDDPRDEEHVCDAFAAHLLVASRDPSMICGLYMGLQLTSAILNQTSASSGSETHPAISARHDRVATLVESSGMALTQEWDALLSIPTRLMEEEIFEGETRLVIFDRTSKRLNAVVGSICSSELLKQVALLLAHHVARLPTLSEMSEPTLQGDNGRRFRIVTFDLITAKQALDNLLGVEATMAAALILECLTAVADQPAPTMAAATIFDALIRTVDGRGCKTKELARICRSEVDLNKTLFELKQLGCVVIGNERAMALNRVEMRMYDRQHGFATPDRYAPDIVRLWL